MPRGIRSAQLLLAVAAAALWIASKLPWVVIRSFDGLGPPKTVTLTGATWSTALLPLAVLLLAAAVAALAVRGWPLRLLAMVVAAASLVIGYLAVSLWVLPDVAVRAADLAGVPVASLVGSGRQYGGALATLSAALCALAAGALLTRSGARSGLAAGGRRATKEVASVGPSVDMSTSERVLWEALDEGRDPTDRSDEADTEGR